MKNGVINNSEYKIVCLKTQQADEFCLQDVLDAMLNRIKMENEEFQKSLMHHMSDPTRLPLIQKARQDNEEGIFDLPQDL